MSQIEEETELEVPEPEVEEDESKGWLYDSERDSGTQLNYYLRYQRRGLSFKKLVPGLKAAREAAGLTQGELADLIGVTRQTYGNYERCDEKRGRVKPETLHKLAEILGTELSELIENRNGG